MLFSSIEFLLVFFPITYGINFLLPKKLRNYWLLICSLFFYAWGEPKFVFVMIFSICMNYLLEEEGLLQTFRWVNNYLDPEGIFLFDMNTEEKYRRIGESTIAENRKEGSFIWQNSFDEQEKINEYDLTLFIPENDGRQRPKEYDDWETDERIFRKTEEVHLEKAYPPETVIRLLEEAGMRFERMYDGYTDRAATEGSQRIVYLARENGKKTEKGV